MTNIQLGIVGSRGFANYPLLEKTIDNLSETYCLRTIISGGAHGADRLAEMYATNHGIQMKVYVPDYKKYARGAPWQRNKEIVQNSDVVVAFWDGVSKGTAHTISVAEKLRKKLIIVRFTNSVNPSAPLMGFLRAA
jgi:YspA, cpYpsA-related SLOG family